MMYSIAAFFSFALLQGVFSSPVGEPAAEVEPRALVPRVPTIHDMPVPALPARSKGSRGSTDNCAAAPVQQTNLCTAGNPYCCTSDGNGGHVCTNSTACTQTVICCNNNNGYQICIGDLDFNMPITINVYMNGRGHH